LDDLLDGYVDWRESARAAADAYARWSFASGPERALRFAAYTATLDQEQKTASAYAAAVTDVERWLQRSDAHRGRWASGNAATTTRAPITGADRPGDARRLQMGRPRRLMAFDGGELELALRELRP
jgi:hypothetical protein